MDLYNAEKVKARKDHKCFLCGDAIQRGTMYFRESGKYEGDFFYRKSCCDCFRHLEEFVLRVDTEFLNSDIYDYLREEYCDDCNPNCKTAPWHCEILLERQREVNR